MYELSIGGYKFLTEIKTGTCCMNYDGLYWCKFDDFHGD